MRQIEGAEYDSTYKPKNVTGVECINNKLWYFCIMEYYLEIKSNKILKHTIWIDLKNIMSAQLTT